MRANAPAIAAEILSGKEFYYDFNFDLERLERKARSRRQSISKILTNVRRTYFSVTQITAANELSLPTFLTKKMLVLFRYFG